MPVSRQVIVIDYHFWLMAALSLWRHFSPSTLINSEATLWRALPAGDSGKDSKMFEPCSQQTQRFCGKRRYEKNNWEQNTGVDFRRDINLLRTNIKKGPKNVSALITKVCLLGPRKLFVFIYLLTYLFIHSFIYSVFLRCRSAYCYSTYCPTFLLIQVYTIPAGRDGLMLSFPAIRERRKKFRFFHRRPLIREWPRLLNIRI